MERHTSENLSRRARAHACFEGRVVQAVEYLGKARALFTGADVARLDPTTIHALDVAARLLALDRLDAARRSEAARDYCNRSDR